MPLHFVIDETIGLVTTTAVGDVAAVDLLEHATKLAAVPNRPTRELVDFTDRSGGSPPLDSVRTMAEFLKEHDASEPGTKLALAASDDEVFGTLRVFEAHREEAALELKVFRTRDEALRWLGIDPAAPAPS